MTSSIEEFGKEIKTFVRDSARIAIDELIDKAVNQAYEKGIAITVSALYEAKVEDNVIINLLHKHWHIDEDEATDRLRFERTVEFPSRALNAYLTSQGLNLRDRNDFMTKNKVRIKLRHDPKLWKLTPAKLMDAVKEIE